MSTEDDGRRRKEQLDRQWIAYVISPDLLEAFGLPLDGSETNVQRDPSRHLWVIIELNLNFPTGRNEARRLVHSEIQSWKGKDPELELRDEDSSRHHVFAYLTHAQVEALVEWDRKRHPEHAIYKIWPDRELEPYIDRSIRTIKSDACLRSYGADGEGILWAIADSGIDAGHPHFKDVLGLKTVSRGGDPELSIAHRDFTPKGDKDSWGRDLYGHGTHVAGILAGESPCPADAPASSGTGTAAKPNEASTNKDQEPLPSDAAAQPPVHAALAGIDPADAGAEGVDDEDKDAVAWRLVRERGADNKPHTQVRGLKRQIRGVAPKCELLILKVLDDGGKGQESALLSALDYVARMNDDGRWLRIHGLNLSLGFGFKAEFFAAGQSPLCVAVNRLVKMGVIVVAAAGNDGSAILKTEKSAEGRRIGLDQSITDPGNAELAITVGSTHAEAPHTYGVSYFSSRGPTADGRPKPDLVAPGERILSCASVAKLNAMKPADPDLKDTEFVEGRAYYREESGTSMAAPHVSGAIAAFLSVRGEFKGQPGRIKQIFLDTATDLKRTRDFQGAGLLDLMRAIQSV